MKFGRAIPTPIRIMPTDSHGFIVDVGFATFACEGPENALRVLGDYLKHPNEFIEALKATRKDKESGDGMKLIQRNIPCPSSIIQVPCGEPKISNPTR